MDPFIAVALSMLPASRSRAASAFKEIRHQSDLELKDALEVVLQACDVPAHERTRASSVARTRAEAALAAARAAGIEPLAWHDPRFPALLSCIPDPPPLLWVRGDVAVLTRPIVAIVGSRAATPYAMDVAHRLGQELSDRGLVVASGLARGVDSAAHRGCLAGEAPTVAVLGSGVDRVYPAEHEAWHGDSRKACCSELWYGIGADRRSPRVGRRPGVSRRARKAGRWRLLRKAYWSAS